MPHKELFDFIVDRAKRDLPPEHTLEWFRIRGAYHHWIITDDWLSSFSYEPPKYKKGITGHLQIKVKEGQYICPWGGRFLKQFLMNTKSENGVYYSFKILYEDYPELMQPLEEQLQKKAMLSKLNGQEQSETIRTRLELEYQYAAKEN